jgi:hypothetical protein
MSGASWWIGPPTTVQGNKTSPSTFSLSTLACAPVFLDWSTIDVLYVYGTQVIPESTYTLNTVFEPCHSPSAYASYYSAVTQVPTSPAWGDVAAPLEGDTVADQPDFRDVAAIVDAFLDRPGAPSLPSADLHPALPNLTIDFNDISECVEAFVAQPYMLAPPNLCPPE